MAKLELRRFETNVYVNKSANDPAQIPAEGAVLTVYKQGATVSAAASVTTGTPVAVYAMGQVALGDILQVGTDITRLATIESIDSDTQLSITAIGSPFSVALGERLLPSNHQPNIYNDSTGLVAHSTPHAFTVGADGYAGFYCPATRFDYIISGSTFIDTLIIDQRSGWERDGVAWVNVRNYATFQAAVDTLGSTGGTVYVPAGTYSQNTVPAFNGLTLNASSVGVKLIGDGAAQSVISYTASANNDFITAFGSWLEIAGLTFNGTGTAGTGRWLVMAGLSNAYIHDCSIQNIPSWSIEDTATGAEVLFQNMRFFANRSNGCVHLSGFALRQRFHNCIFNPTVGQCVKIENGSGHTFFGCHFEPQQDNSSTDGDLNAALFIQSCGNVVVDGCFFTSATANNPPNNWFVFLKDPGPCTGVISNSTFVRSNGAVSRRRMVKGKYNGTLSPRGVRFRLENLYSSTGSAPTGIDDIVQGTYDYFTLVGDTDDAVPTITVVDNTRIVRISNARRLKLEGLTTASRDALTGNLIGDIISNQDLSGHIQTYNGTIWKTLGVPAMTVAARGGQSWSVGDMVYETDTGKMSVCTVSGAPGTWKVWTLT